MPGSVRAKAERLRDRWGLFIVAKNKNSSIGQVSLTGSPATEDFVRPTLKVGKPI